jgi:hypothetical protein
MANKLIFLLCTTILLFPPEAGKLEYFIVSPLNAQKSSANNEGVSQTLNVDDYFLLNSP